MNDADSALNRLAPSSSGLTLVLPSLKALKELNAKKKSSPLLEPTPVKKNTRPVKLKPLKEVLTSLITKIKKCAYNGPSFIQLLSNFCQEG
jgi:bromodomain-containing protein 7